MIDIRIPTADALEDICQALAEGEHDLGPDATAAGYILTFAWEGPDGERATWAECARWIAGADNDLMCVENRAARDAWE